MLSSFFENPTFWVFLLGPLMLVVIGWISTKLALQRKEKLRKIATKLALEYSAGTSPFAAGATEQTPPFVIRVVDWIFRVFAPWHIKGQYRGARIEIFPEKRGSGKNSRVYTIVHVFFKEPQNLGLSLRAEGIFSKIGQGVFGLKDIKIGKDDFDGKVRVQANDEGRAVGLLARPDLQRAILDLLEFQNDCVFQDDRLVLERKGTLTDENEIREILDRFSAVAQLFY